MVTITDNKQRAEEDQRLSAKQTSQANMKYSTRAETLHDQEAQVLRKREIIKGDREHHKHVHSMINAAKTGQVNEHGEGGKSSLEYLARNKPNPIGVNTFDPLSQTYAINQAARFNQADAVDYLISIGADINLIDDLDGTPLHAAISRGHIHMAQKLLGKQGIRVDAVNNNNETPLHLAANLDNDNLIRILVERKATLDSMSTSTITTGPDSTQKGSLEVKKGNTPAHNLAKAGNISMLQLFLDSGLKIDVINGDKNTLLHVISIYNDKADVAKFLIKNKININAQNALGETALIIAAKEGNLPMVETLIEGEADTKFKDNSGKTAVAWAAKRDRGAIIAFFKNLDEASAQEITEAEEKEVEGDATASSTEVEFLMKYIVYPQSKGLNITTINLQGTTALHLAAASGFLKTLKDLLYDEEGKPGLFDIDTQDKEGDTPLSASIAGLLYVDKYASDLATKLIENPNIDTSSAPIVSKDTFRYLMHKNANISIANNDGEMIMHNAARSRHLYAMNKILAKDKEQLHAEAEHGAQPIHFAAETLKLDSIKFLVDQGANPHAYIKSGPYKGYKAIHLANEKAQDPQTPQTFKKQAQSIIKFFIDLGVQFDKVEIVSSKESPLHLAAQKGENIDVFKFLINGLGLKIDAVDENGKKPADIAKDNNHIELSQQLFMLERNPTEKSPELPKAEEVKTADDTTETNSSKTAIEEGKALDTNSSQIILPDGQVNVSTTTDSALNTTEELEVAGQNNIATEEVM